MPTLGDYEFGARFDQEGEIMRAKVLAGIVLILALPVGASAAKKNPTFQLVVNSEQFDGNETYTAKSYQKLADVEISPSSAVQLDGDVPLELAKAIAIDLRAPLTAESTLYATGIDQTTYCGTGWSTRFSARLTPCLIDSDGDGSFDHAARTLPIISTPEIAVIDDQTLTGNVFYPQVALPAPIPYHLIDSTKVRRVAGIIVWESDYDRSKPGPVHFVLRIHTTPIAQSAPLYSGTFYSQTKSLTFDGTPTDVDFFGVKVTVVGVNEHGALIYRLAGHIDNATVGFMMKLYHKSIPDF